MQRSHRSPLVWAALLAGLLVSLGAAPTPDEARRLAAGEILVRLVETPGGGPKEGVGMGVVDAPPSRVFAALTDFAHYQEWVPFVRTSDARRQLDGSVVSAQSLHLPALVGDRSYKIRAVSVASGKAWTTRWTYVPGSGDVVDTYGSWSVVEFGPGRSLATCRLFTDPGRVPHWAMNRATEQSLPWIFKGLRQQVMRDRYLHD
jgi:polyketide cyclase/dehydrase/lipid transport protein